MQIGDEAWMTLEASGWRSRALKAEVALAFNTSRALASEAREEAAVAALRSCIANARLFNRDTDDAWCAIRDQVNAVLRAHDAAQGRDLG